MACGCPVITSNVSSLPEIAGDAALLVDPGDVRQLSHAMERLLHDDGLYDELRARGITRAEGFSWEQAAEELLDLLIATD
jgi:alpha-1,3-rhamnosyl/mannosyltransferase